jgi:excinuclease UvrABC nuclease subunit
MGELLPWLQRKRTKIVNLKTINEQAIPEKPGAYIMLSDNTKFQYPRRKSRVYYIGQSTNLRQRVWIRRKWCLVAKDKPSDEPWFTIYEYAGRHGCKICWIVCRNEESPKHLEYRLLRQFQQYSGARPHANGTTAWK